MPEHDTGPDDDPRIEAAAIAIADLNSDGPKWRSYIEEARVAIEAADAVPHACPACRGRGCHRRDGLNRVCRACDGTGQVGADAR